MAVLPVYTMHLRSTAHIRKAYNIDLYKYLLYTLIYVFLSALQASICGLVREELLPRTKYPIHSSSLTSSPVVVSSASVLLLVVFFKSQNEWQYDNEQYQEINYVPRVCDDNVVYPRVFKINAISGACS